MYLANKVIKFDKEYMPGDEIPTQVIEGNRLAFLLRNELVKEVAKAGAVTPNEAPANTSNEGEEGNEETPEIHDGETPDEIIEVSELSYEELKELAISKGLTFAGNISKAKLIELIEG